MRQETLPKRPLLATLLLLAALFPAPALAGGDGDDAAENPQALIDRWATENDRCRGGSGDDDETFQACDRRDALTTQLNAAGWCYGHDGQAEFEREWEVCE